MDRAADAGFLGFLMKHLSPNACGEAKELWERDVPRAYKLSQEGWGALRRKKKMREGRDDAEQTRKSRGGTEQSKWRNEAERK